MGKFIDRTGQKFGRLTFLRKIPRSKGERHLRWVCQCECGTEKEYLGYLVVQGHTKSCGCHLRDFAASLRKTHGLSKTRTYRIWKGMRRRCLSDSSGGWAYYGGRGIGVATEWSDFEAFLRDMGEAPEGMSLERIDNNRGYGPDNCRWATHAEQCSNQRKNHWIEFKGQRHTMAQWARLVDLTPQVISGRLRKGWTVERALTTPVKCSAVAPTTHPDNFR